jgi:hypothetical protein
MLALLLSLVACGDGTVIIEGDAPRTGELDDTDANDTASPEPEEPPPARDLGVWQGTRTFFYDASDDGYYCDESVRESGVEVPVGSNTRAVLEDACGECDHFYEVTPERAQACGWITLASPTWRGVRLAATGETELHAWYADGRELVEIMVADATFDGATLRYDYRFEAYGRLEVDVAGVVEFPVATDE